MRILVVSDVHGRSDRLREAILRQPTAGTVIFLGDGLRQVEQAAEEFPDRIFYMVPGNCDFGSELLPVRQETVGGKRFYFTHGHRHDVKYTLYRLELAAREAEADIALLDTPTNPTRNTWMGCISSIPAVWGGVAPTAMWTLRVAASAPP